MFGNSNPVRGKVPNRFDTSGYHLFCRTLSFVYRDGQYSYLDSDSNNAATLLSAFEEKEELASLVTESLSDSEKKDNGTGIQVYIGNESPIQTMKDCSVVTATYDLGEGVKGTIGIVGPKRMDYEKVMDNLKTLKSQLDGIYKKSEDET